MLYEQLNAAVFQASPYRRPDGRLDERPGRDDAARRARVLPALVRAGQRGRGGGRRRRRRRRCGALAEKYYGGIPARAVPARKPRDEPAQAGMRRIEFKAPAEQAYVALAFKVPQLRPAFDAPMRANDDALALTVLSAVLDGYSGARLDRALTQGAGPRGRQRRRGQRPVGPRAAAVHARRRAGRRQDAPSRSKPRCAPRSRKVARDGVSEAELKRVKTQWIASEVYKLDSVMSQARELGSYWVQGLPLDAGERLIARLRGVTAAAGAGRGRASTSATTS